MARNDIHRIADLLDDRRLRPVPRPPRTDHHLANGLSLTTAVLRMQRRRSALSAVRSAIQGAEARIVCIAKYYEYLDRSGSEAGVDLADLFWNVLPDLGEAVGVRCLLAIIAARPVKVSNLVARQVMLIVNELALNARQHGYGGRIGGCISLELDTEREAVLTVSVVDSGAGLPDGFDPYAAEGLGLRIVTDIVRALGGSIECRSDGGARFTVTIPAG
jgi:two-component system, sensor histidine kinase PdtaS